MLFCRSETYIICKYIRFCGLWVIDIPKHCLIHKNHNKRLGNDIQSQFRSTFTRNTRCSASNFWKVLENICRTVLTIRTPCFFKLSDLLWLNIKNSIGFPWCLESTFWDIIWRHHLAIQSKCVPVLVCVLAIKRKRLSYWLCISALQKS